MFLIKTTQDDIYHARLKSMHVFFLSPSPPPPLFLVSLISHLSSLISHLSSLISHLSSLISHLSPVEHGGHVLRRHAASLPRRWRRLRPGTAPRVRLGVRPGARRRCALRHATPRAGRLGGVQLPHTNRATRHRPGECGLMNRMVWSDGQESVV